MFDSRIVSGLLMVTVLGCGAKRDDAQQGQSTDADRSEQGMMPAIIDLSPEAAEDPTPTPQVVSLDLGDVSAAPSYAPLDTSSDVALALSTFTLAEFQASPMSAGLVFYVEQLPPGHADGTAWSAIRYSVGNGTTEVHLTVVTGEGWPDGTYPVNANAGTTGAGLRWVTYGPNPSSDLDTSSERTGASGSVTVKRLSDGRVSVSIDNLTLLDAATSASSEPLSGEVESMVSTSCSAYLPAAPGTQVAVAEGQTSDGTTLQPDTAWSSQFCEQRKAQAPAP